MTRPATAISFLALSGTLLAAALAAACGGSTGEADNTTVDATPLAAAVALVSEVDLPSYVEAGGTVQARSTATITSRIVAPILEVHVRPGDAVRRGQRLVTLDAREPAAQAARAAAALTAATEAAQAAASREVAAAAALELAEATHTRIAALHEKRSATPQELDQAVAGRDQARAQVEAARADRAATEAQVGAARSAGDAAIVSASYAVLTAPFDGVVAEQPVDPGSLAAPGVPLVIVEEAGPRRLEVRLDAARVETSEGQTAQVEADGRWLDAEIVEVGRTDPDTQSVLVKIELPDGREARTGTFGRARFSGPSRRALVVPSSALVERGQLTLVFVVDADGRARLRPVRTGVVDADRTEIVAGLSAGDLVVTAPDETLADGRRVEGPGVPRLESRP